MNFFARLFARQAAVPEPPGYLPGETIWRVGDTAQCDYAAQYWFLLSGALIAGPTAGDRDTVCAVDRLPADLLELNPSLASTQLLVFARFPDKRFIASEFTRVPDRHPGHDQLGARIIRLADHLPRKTGFPGPSGPAANPSQPKGPHA